MFSNRIFTFLYFTGKISKNASAKPFHEKYTNPMNINNKVLITGTPLASIFIISSNTITKQSFFRKVVKKTTKRIFVLKILVPKITKKKLSCNSNYFFIALFFFFKTLFHSIVHKYENIIIRSNTRCGY